MELDITIAEIKQICGLKELKSDDLFTSKMIIINQRIKEISQIRFYNQLVNKKAKELVVSSFKTAFAYLIYAECLDFLNTNTIGNGIIKSTGFADSRTELISSNETEQRRNKLEFMAYHTLKNYLNPAGLKRYRDLKLWDDLQKTDDQNAKRLIIPKARTRMALI